MSIGLGAPSIWFAAAPHDGCDMVRGAIAGALKMKLGFEVSSETFEGRGRVYKFP